MSFVSRILEGESAVFFLINNKLSYERLDGLMLLLRDSITWVPLYLFLLLFFFFNCRRYIIPIIIFSLVTFAIADYVSASLLKPMIGRLRPCHNPNLGFVLKNIAGCGGLFGMPSTHASNHFALATFWYTAILNTIGQKWRWLWLWALAICYAQIYVGVHYPLDIITGAVFGTLVGYMTGRLYKGRIAMMNKVSDSQ